MSESLKPCPANGPDCQLEVMSGMGEDWVLCHCGFTGPMKNTRADAIAAWNRRSSPASPAIVEALEKAKKVIDSLDMEEDDDHQIADAKAFVDAALAALRQQDAAKENPRG